MNIWDSVHRSLDKASKEAGRIARMQRLRSQLDKVARQINTQESALLHQVMDLFTSGRLTQGELLPLCHELMSLQQQLSQAQNELQTLQSQVQQTPQAGQEINTAATGEVALTTYAPPPSAPTYQPFDATMPAILPPPPPPESQTLHSQETVMNTMPVGTADDAFTIIAQETVRAYDEAAQSGTGRNETAANENRQEGVENRKHCPQCNVEALPGYYFCHNCGAALLPQESNYQPTVRGSGSFYPQSGQETILPPSGSGNNELVGPYPSSDKGDATVYDAHNAYSVNDAYSKKSVLPPPPSNTVSEVKDAKVKDGGQ